MLRRGLIGLMLVVVGCVIDKAAADGAGTDAAGTDLASDETGPACAPAVPQSEPLGVVEITVRNMTDADAFVIGRAAEWGEDLRAYRLYGSDGVEIKEEVSKCVPWCNENGVTCPTQCVGAHQGVITISPGDELQAQWSGLAQQQVAVPDACDDMLRCGRDECVAFGPAPAGSYSVGVRITSACQVASGDPCDCASCVGQTDLDVAEVVAAFEYDGANTVTIDFVGDGT